jgi:tRNA threonylcarbamoyladenosine biosynthesis protein TsaE
MNLEIFLPNDQKTLQLGEFLGINISKPLTVLFFGDIGAGKTYFSKGIGIGLGVKEEITSPTFTLINHYKLEKFDLYHLDLYRLNSLKEILDLGIEDFIDNNSIVLIEWAEKLGGYNITDNSINIELKHFKNGRNCIISSNKKDFDFLLVEIKSFVNTWN